ncbi:MAG: hypothetical protein GON13_00525 [Nanoarchaeota archaeon]|nr:hypothetical protein [Nanoarchaeota archaeon]
MIKILDKINENNSLCIYCKRKLENNNDNQICDSCLKIIKDYKPNTSSLTNLKESDIKQLNKIIEILSKTFYVYVTGSVLEKKEYNDIDLVISYFDYKKLNDNIEYNYYNEVKKKTSKCLDNDLSRIIHDLKNAGFNIKIIDLKIGINDIYAYSRIIYRFKAKINEIEFDIGFAPLPFLYFNRTPKINFTQLK